MKKRIAVVGSGISGLTSAYLLSQKHDVTLFEKDQRLGGHTATVDVKLDGQSYAVDTGFIVFNDRTYPLFLKLLNRIGLAKQETEMSFSVRNLGSGLEYNGHDLNTLFAQRKNLFSLTFWRLIRQILKFNKLAKQAYHSGNIDPNLTLGDFLAEHQFSEFFATHYILPMGAAIWSTSLEQITQFPLNFFVQFFYHHGLLNVADRPQWYVIPGGSRSYIPHLIKPLGDNVILNADIKAIQRTDKGVTLALADGVEHHFDDVVLACHSDQALALLSDATEQELNVLGSLKYSDNDVVLHTDDSMLPKSRLAWASWNYRLTEDTQRPAAVTYNMNILQGIQSRYTFCVTLNQSEKIDSKKVLGRFNYAHPVIDNDSYKVQQQRASICGQNHTHFAGAYWYNGFHEDGVRSAVDVAKRFGIEL
jgi:predicted NAD/FAD-binding protein